MATYWVNSDGLRVRFGPLTDADQGDEKGGVMSTPGPLNYYVLTFDYDDLPNFANLGTASDSGVPTLPAGAKITNAWLYVEQAFQGGTSYDIGLETADDGTDIDADGLWDGLVLADIDTTGEACDARDHGGTNSGALFLVKLTEPAVPLVVATGTFTAGRAKLVIEYLQATA